MIKKSLLALVLLTHCKTTESAKTQALSVSPSALIGTAFDAHTGEFTGMTCIDASLLSPVDYELVKATWSEPAIEFDVKAERVESLFGSLQKSFYTAATGFRLSRPYETANRIPGGPLELTHFVSKFAQGGRFRFRESSHRRLQLNASAKQLARAIQLAKNPKEKTESIAAFVAMCGTGFLSGTSFALGIGARLRWEFKSLEEKNSWAPATAAGSIDESLGALRPKPGARLYYESFMKETREVNWKRLNEVGIRDCSEDQPEPCLKAFQRFTDSTLPAYEKIIEPRLHSSDLALSQAFLSQPEISRYRDIEPALASIVLEPDHAAQQAWQLTRQHFVILASAAARIAQRAAPDSQAELKIEIHNLQQDISSRAAPCYRPILDIKLCAAAAEALRISLQDLQSKWGLHPTAHAAPDF